MSKSTKNQLLNDLKVKLNDLINQIDSTTKFSSLKQQKQEQEQEGLEEIEIELIEIIKYLWDVSIDQKSAQIIIENKVLLIFIDLFQIEEISDRLLEVSIGSIGNLVSIMSEKNLDQMMKEQQGEELMNLVIGLIFSRVDVPLLCEICRLLSGCLSDENFGEKIIELMIKDENQLLTYLINILLSSLNENLIEKTCDLFVRSLWFDQNARIVSRLIEFGSLKFLLELLQQQLNPPTSTTSKVLQKSDKIISLLLQIIDLLINQSNLIDELQFKLLNYLNEEGNRLIESMHEILHQSISFDFQSLINVCSILKNIIELLSTNINENINLIVLISSNEKSIENLIGLLSTENSDLIDSIFTLFSSFFINLFQIRQKIPKKFQSTTEIYLKYSSKLLQSIQIQIKQLTDPSDPSIDTIQELLSSISIFFKDPSIEKQTNELQNQLDIFLQQ